MARILYVHSRRNTFTRIDRDALEERHEVVDYFQDGLQAAPGRAVAEGRRVRRVVGWFASWHTALALRFARMRRKPSLLIFGGFDTAAMPEIGYGSQRGGVRRRLVRSTAGLATRLVTNSNLRCARSRENVGHRPGRRRGRLPRRSRTASPTSTPRHPRERMALTVGAVYDVNLARKGHGPFCEAAASAARCRVRARRRVVGRDRRASSRRRRPRTCGSPATSPTRIWTRSSARLRVYVQASLHEGFGMSLAEAMLAGAVPVVTAAGALPEVVGDTGVVIAEANAQSASPPA